PVAVVADGGVVEELQEDMARPVEGERGIELADVGHHGRAEGSATFRLDLATLAQRRRGRGGGIAGRREAGERQKAPQPPTQLHHGSLGSSASRRPSPSRLKPSTASRMEAPGAMSSHGAVMYESCPS